jgi:hypothetical protein
MVATRTFAPDLSITSGNGKRCRLELELTVVLSGEQLTSSLHYFFLFKLFDLFRSDTNVI